MKKAEIRKSQFEYRSESPRSYLEKIDSDILNSFNPEQLQAITSVLNEAIPKSSPKIVDLRFVVDLVVSRFYVVLLVGKDRRKKQRQYVPEKLVRVTNLIAAGILLIGLNLVFSAFILLIAYLLKSAIGINLFPDQHLPDVLKKLLP